MPSRDGNAPQFVSVGGLYPAAFAMAPETAAVALALSGAVAASFGFALPVATPPNAIAYGTGEVTRAQMLRAGVALDAAVIVVTLLSAVAIQTIWPALR